VRSCKAKKFVQRKGYNFVAALACQGGLGIGKSTGKKRKEKKKKKVRVHDANRRLQESHHA
jgi:hypothetical protein